MFAITIGYCTIVPPSGKAAVLMILLLFGVNVHSENDIKLKEYQIAEQYIASGLDAEAATAKIGELNNCFASWNAPKKEARR